MLTLSNFAVGVFVSSEPPLLPPLCYGDLNGFLEVGKVKHRSVIRWHCVLFHFAGMHDYATYPRRF